MEFSYLSMMLQFRHTLAYVVLLLLLSTGSIGETVSENGSSGLKLHQVQLVGVHGSYHVQPRKKLLDFLTTLSSQFEAWEYTHKPLPQLLAKGIRSFQLNVSTRLLFLCSSNSKFLPIREVPTYSHPELTSAFLRPGILRPKWRLVFETPGSQVYRRSS